MRHACLPLRYSRVLAGCQGVTVLSLVCSGLLEWFTITVFINFQGDIGFRGPPGRPGELGIAVSKRDLHILIYYHACP